MKLLHVRQMALKKLQMELAELIQKRRWFFDRERSIEEESLKLEEESRQARRKGDIKRERTIEEFLENLKEALPQITSKKEHVEAEIERLRKRLEEASKEQKVVEKLEELHYNQRIMKRRKGEG